MKQAVIILPTFNEVETVGAVIERVFSVAKNVKNWQLSILVIDSSSPDKTADEVRRLQKKYSQLYMLTTKKEGLGKAYLSGFTYALDKLKAEVVFEMDADLSHDPKVIPNFFAKINQGADFVIGSRYIPGGSIPADWSWDRKLFSVLGNLIIRFGFMKLKITDWTSGYRAIRSSVIESSLKHVSKYSGYVFQVALLDEALKRNSKITEVPIKFVDREYGVSKISSFQYIFQTLLYVFLNSSFIRFGIVGVIGAVIDFGLSYILIERLRFYIWVSTLISAESAIISNFLLNNFWSFSHKRLKENYLAKFFYFNLISSGSLLIQTVGVQASANAFGADLWYVYKILIIAFIVIPYSYILYNKVVWKSKQTS